MMNAGQHLQRLPLPNTTEFNESDEGGLNLGQIVGAIRRRILIVGGVTVVVASAAVFKALNDTPMYQAQFEILTEPVTVENEVISSVPQTLTSRREGEATSGAVDETKIRVLLSPEVLSPIGEQLRIRYPDITYDLLVSNLRIGTSGPNILAVTYQSSDPKLVRDVLDLVAKAYLNYSLEDRRKDILQGLKFVEEQLPTLKGRVESQQERLQRIRQNNNLVDPGITGQQLSTQIGTLEQQRLDTQLQLNEAQSLYANLQTELAQRPGEKAAALALSDSPRYQKILDSLQEIDSQIAKESARFLDESPTLGNLRLQRQNLLPLLNQEGERAQRELASRIQGLEVRNQSLNQNIENLKLQVKQLSGINREYTDIQRELQIATDNLNQFLAKREALRIDAAQRQIPWRLLAPIGDPQATAASVNKNLALGTILGLLLGLGGALVVDKLSNVLYTSKEVKEVTKLPLLGVIPFEREVEEFAQFASTVNGVSLVPQLGHNNGRGHSDPFQGYRADSFFEVFRSLYTSIRLLGSDTPIRSLAISSAARGDGKTTVAVHLAQAAAAMGQRVLLVDTNLRRPCIHDLVGLRNIQGLTDVISTDLDFQDVIERSPLEDNLFVLTAGPIPPDPIRLLASQKMQDLMEKFQAAFDLVIYDTPPLLGVADAYLLATHTNGIVLVAGVGKLKRLVLEQALEELRVAGTPVLGVVANRAKESIPSSQGYPNRHHIQNPKAQKFNEILKRGSLNQY